MISLSAARKLLAELPEDDAKALEEITAWLNSVADAAGFESGMRFDLVTLLDETGWPIYADMLRDWLSTPHLHDFEGTHTWHHMHRFCNALSRAYDECLSGYQRDEDHSKRLEKETVSLCVRQLRSTAEQLKLELMRYIDVSPAVWERMYHAFGAAEADDIALDMLSAYSSRGAKTSPQNEFLRALMLHASAPGNLSPDQIEVCFRVARRMVEFFDLTTERDGNSEYALDLNAPRPPEALADNTPTGPEVRYFGAMRALPAIAEIIAQHEEGGLPDEKRFGDEFTPQGKLTVLKHLLVHWDKHHPHRRLIRRGTSANVEIVHGFRTISKVMPHFDLGATPGLSAEDAASLAARSSAGLDPAFLPEMWTIVDASLKGMGAMIPKAGGAWIKVGSLCAIKVQNAQAWWVGVIRRLHTDAAGIPHAGIEILGKRSLAVWLRSPAADPDEAEYDYSPAILLPDEENSYMNATMLLESGAYAREKRQQMLLGESVRRMEITTLEAEGDDYELVKFRWLNA